MDVLDDVLVRHRDRGPVRLQILHPGLPQLLGHDGEVEAQVLHVSLVGLEVEQVLVQLRIEGGEMINVDSLLSEEL